MTKVWLTVAFPERSYHNLNFKRILPVLGGVLLFNNLELVLGMALKFYTSVAKELKLNFLHLEKLQGEN